MSSLLFSLLSICSFYHVMINYINHTTCAQQTRYLYLETAVLGLVFLSRWDCTVFGIILSLLE